jgi:hypothetical protein
MCAVLKWASSAARSRHFADADHFGVGHVARIGIENAAVLFRVAAITFAIIGSALSKFAAGRRKLPMTRIIALVLPIQKLLTA